jgi:hypothetical protein
MRRQTSGRVFLGGHSYGGRQASILSAAELTRFTRRSVPVIYVPRTSPTSKRDGFGSIDELVAALALIPARTELLPVPATGHELMTKKNRDELPMMVVETFRLFASDVVA